VGDLVCPWHGTLTRFVLVIQHPKHTQAVLNPRMKSVGERIRQARDACNMSADALAQAVGYSHQSAIANIENRKGGLGGKKLPEIAKALRVPLMWLIEGPDSAEVPFLYTPPPPIPFPAAATPSAQESIPEYLDGSIQEAVTLFRMLNTEQRLEVINHMRRLAGKAGASWGEKPGEEHGDTISKNKAA
jgi:transcriptional regulator with XRE-family HTH domain